MNLYHFECVIRPAGVDADNEPISTDADFRVSVAVIATNEESAMYAIELELGRLYFDGKSVPYWAESMAEEMRVTNLGEFNAKIVGNVSVYRLDH